MSLRRFKTFEGVFTPCLLSILGVIMYLRLGWVVGQTGLGGALLIISLANLITLATALSMSSVITNIRIGDGGAYSIITKSLGIEAGGAIGLPLYISQAISVAFYITGFTECWLTVFPSHNALLVSLILWLALLVVSMVSTKMAFRIQYLVMSVIALSIISMVVGPGGSTQPLTWMESFQLNDFWTVFAIFFPAVTGILAGASMSGELINPKRSIPLGTLSAIGVSFCIYVLLAYLFALYVPAAELKTKYSSAVEMGRWPWMVVGGIMGATLSSALSMFVSSPRVLLALGKHSIVPGSAFLTRVNKKGEPTSAILFTAMIVLVTLLYGTLDKIAGLLTMFFLITYGMINLTVFMEESMGIASFRPIFRVPRLVPFLGTLGCVSIMFLIDARFSFTAIVVITVLYVFLAKREAETYSPNIRSGVLIFFAEFFAKAADKLPYYPKIWKPNLLIFLSKLDGFEPVVHFIRAIIYPAGRLTVFKLEFLSDRNHSPQNKQQSAEELVCALEPLRREGLYVEKSVVVSKDYYETATILMQAVRGMIFPPNTLFHVLDDSALEDRRTEGIVQKASHEDFGVILLKYNEEVGFSQEKVVNLWIRRQSPNLDLSVLVALQLQRNWEGDVRLLQVVDHERQKRDALNYLNRLKILMRLPATFTPEVVVGKFRDVIKEPDPADVNIFGMKEEPDLGSVREVASYMRTSVLFVKDSKHESALA